MSDNQGDNQGSEADHTFKVGDKVVVVKPEGMGDGDCSALSSELEDMSNSWVDEMNEFVGQTGTVSSRSKGGAGGYRLSGYPYSYLPEWLELMARAEEPYAPGTKVVLISPAPGLNIPSVGTTCTIEQHFDECENGEIRYTVMEDSFIYHSHCFKPLASGQQEDSMGKDTHLECGDIAVGNVIHLKQDIEVDGTPFNEDETLTVVAVHDDIGHVVFQDEDELVGITSLDNVKEGAGPSMDKPYEFEGVVEFEGCFDLDDEGVGINTTSYFDEEHNLVTGKEYKVSVRIEEKE